jgi:hypothetical protein
MGSVKPEFYQKAVTISRKIPLKFAHPFFLTNIWPFGKIADNPQQEKQS